MAVNAPNGPEVAPNVLDQNIPEAPKVSRLALAPLAPEVAKPPSCLLNLGGGGGGYGATGGGRGRSCLIAPIGVGVGGMVCPPPLCGYPPADAISFSTQASPI